MLFESNKYLISYSLIKLFTNHISFLAFEMYDFRCTDVKKLFFPNHCHSNYTAEKFWGTITDQIDIQFVRENTSKLDTKNLMLFFVEYN